MVTLGQCGLGVEGEWIVDPDVDVRASWTTAIAEPAESARSRGSVTMLKEIGAQLVLLQRRAWTHVLALESPQSST